MPTVIVDAEGLFDRVKNHVKELKDSTFDLNTFVNIIDKLTFAYGLEYDGLEENSDSTRPRVRLEIPANRYDLLCMDGIADALNRFQSDTVSAPIPLKKADPSVSITVKSSTFPLRPYCVGAIFRNVKFDEMTYASFIDLQDKLHQNLARRRTLVAIGTHNLDALKVPFTYECVSRDNGFKFVPLNQTEAVDGNGMFDLLANTYLKPYLPIISHQDLCPVILDAERRVASVPPIINSELSKMSVNTTNVFIEITAVDYHKAEIVLDQLCAFLSHLTASPVECVKIIYEDGHPGVLDHRTHVTSRELVTPRLNTNKFELSLDYCRRLIGLKSLTKQQVMSLLPKMSLTVTDTADADKVLVECPITRRDILHPCDIAEDVAIALGYNNIAYSAVKAVKFQNIQNISENVRRLAAAAGWKECLTFGLISLNDGYGALGRTPKPTPRNELYSIDTQPIVVSEPKTREFEIVRPTLIPGLLNTLSSNQASNLPIRLFEIGDVAWLDEQDADNRAKQQCNFAALIADSNKSCLEHIHGLLDHILGKFGFNAEYSSAPNARAHHTYYLKEYTDGVFLEKRAIQIMVYTKSRDDAKCIGVMGVVHPKTLGNYSIPFPCSVFEVTLDPLLSWLDDMSMSAP